jgi:hypothetical protein
MRRVILPDSGRHVTAAGPAVTQPENNRGNLAAAKIIVS